MTTRRAEARGRTVRAAAGARPRAISVLIGSAMVISGAACNRAPGAGAGIDPQAELGAPAGSGIGAGAGPVVLGGKPVSTAELGRGAAAYTHYCRACHGERGDGAGISASGLRPPPRDLRLGVYKFAAVAAGQLPSDDDFRRTIKGGLHGTAMLAWDVPDRQLDDLISYVKAFSPRWRTEKPGTRLELAADPWTNREQPAIERGSRVYHGMAQCAVACHPAYVSRAEIVAFTRELTGMRVEDFRPDLYLPVAKPSEYGVAILPTDFTFSPLRAGDLVPDIARTIAAGIGGTAMPTWKGVLPDADLWAMAHYVRSLVALRGTPEGDALQDRLSSQPAWSPPPSPLPPPPRPDGSDAGGRSDRVRN